MNENAFPNGKPLVELTKPRGKYPWTVQRDFVYRWRGRNYVCPEGYETDFLSVPRFLWVVLSPTGEGAYGALIHDILYSAEIKDRETSDRIFYHAMLDSGCRKWKADVMFQSVRAFGGLTWRQHDPLEVLADREIYLNAMKEWN